MPGRTVSRTAGPLDDRRPRRWHLRFWSELGSQSGEHDAFIKVVIVERLARAVVLVAAAISLLVVGRLGYLPVVIAEVQEQVPDYAPVEDLLRLRPEVPVTSMIQMIFAVEPDTGIIIDCALTKASGPDRA